MNLALDHLMAVAADEMLLDDPDLLLAEEGNDPDIGLEDAPTQFLRRRPALEAA